MKTKNGTPLTLASEADESMGRNVGNFIDVKRACEKWLEKRGILGSARGNFNFSNKGLAK